MAAAAPNDDGQGDYDKSRRLRQIRVPSGIMTAGIRHQASGNMHQASGIRHQASGIIQKTSGIRHQASGNRKQA